MFDIDDTITKETEFMIKHAGGFLKRKYHTDFPVVNPNGYSVSDVFGLEKYLAERNFADEKLDMELNKISSAFWNKYFIQYLFYPIKREVPKTIRFLRSEGHQIYFVTLRGKQTHEKENYLQQMVREKLVPLLTRLQLIINHIKYDKLILVKNNKEKITIAKNLNATMLFDDNVEVLEHLDESILPVCIETSHNILFDFQNEKIVRIPFDFISICDAVGCKHNPAVNMQDSKSWRIRKKKIKHLKVYQRVYTEAAYRFLRLVGKGRVLKCYKPIVLGIENLPKEKQASVYVGNHRNIKDPLITIALLKNPTHFTALQRMFDYNENIFGQVGKNVGTVMTSFFVKAVGALPIARPTDDNYRMINLQTFQYISDYLKADSSIAIYPEGTLNREPAKNGNILPLKSNQSFKIAENGKAIIRPVAIVWIPKELKIENRVIVSFCNPIYTQGLKAKEIAEIWSGEMNRAINVMNRIVEEISNITNCDY